MNYQTKLGQKSLATQKTAETFTFLTDHQMSPHWAYNLEKVNKYGAT